MDLQGLQGQRSDWSLTHWSCWLRLIFLLSCMILSPQQGARTLGHLHPCAMGAPIPLYKVGLKAPKRGQL